MSEADDRYPTETLHENYDDGTMPDNVDRLAAAVVGRRIISVEKDAKVKARYPSTYRPYETATVITLDDGRRVALRDTDDCCAFTELEAFLLHPERVDHIITGVGTTDGFTRWHIYADMGDVLELEVGWSCGNPFYYGYGFNITVESVADAVIESEVSR